MGGAYASPPGKVQAIGVMHLIGGIWNLLTATGYVAYVILSLGFGFLACCPAVALLVIGIFEIVSGARHLSSNHAGIAPPLGVGITEICTLALCSIVSPILGILTLVFLSDPEVKAYYQSKQLTG